MFVVPGVVALALEPMLFLLADRYPRRWFVRGGLLAQAITTALAAIAPGPISLCACLSIWAVAVGVGTSLGQATLVDNADDKERVLARWTLASLVGDLAGPLLLAAMAWRSAFAITSIACLAFALVIRVPDGSTTDEEDEAPLWQALKDALKDRALLGWLFAIALCDLLDEIFVVFASLRANEFGAPWPTITLIAFMAGAAIGLMRTWTLRTCAAACTACYLAWLLAPTAWLVALLAAFVGATAAPLYPLCAARAYARRPGASGSVLAASHLFTPLGLALPLLIGVVADRAGLVPALALLIVQPLALVIAGSKART